MVHLLVCELCRISLTCDLLLAFRKECTDIECAEDRKISFFHQQNILMWNVRGRVTF